MARIIYAEEKPIAVEPAEPERTVRVLRREADLPGEVIGMFHSLRQKGNDAVHEGAGTIQEAKSLLKIAYKLGVWFMQTYGDWDFRPEPYREPEPRLEPEEIRREIEEKYRRKQEQRERELEQKLAAELERMRLTTLSHKEMLNRRAQARRAANRLDLTEEETRRIIDEQLALAGWDVDSRRIRYAKGARPEKGKNQAIAEWPTACGPADYALFIGLRLVGLVEAKKISRKTSPRIWSRPKSMPATWKSKGKKGDHSLGGLPGSLRFRHQRTGLLSAGGGAIGDLVPGSAQSAKPGTCLARLVFPGGPGGKAVPG